MKRTRYLSYIATALLLILLLPLLAGCAQQKYATASAEIPEGWEVVSTEGNVTHIRLKEGSDAYHWVDYTYDSWDAEYPMDVTVAGNPDRKPIRPDKDGNVYFIVYFAHIETQMIDGEYVLVDDPENTDNEPYKLYVEYANIGSAQIRGSIDELAESNQVALEPIPNPDPGYSSPDARLGFKQAVMVAVPFHEIGTGWYSFVFEIGQSSIFPNVNIHNDRYLSYCTMDNTLFFKSSDVDAYLNETPFSWLAKHFFIINPILLAISLAVMILCCIWKKNRFFHFIPLLIGVVMNILIASYYSALPTPDEMFAGFEYFGEQIFALAMQWIHIIAGIILLVIRWIVDKIRRKISRKAADSIAIQQPTDP